MTDTVVVGLDGANWGLIDPWLERGDLPNIRRMREEGTDAVSRSELPPVTCPSWKCYSASKNPGDMGVFWWELIDPETGTISFPDARSFQTAELWDYLGDAGREWFCLNMPTTYPPRDIPGGRIVAGGPICDDTGYTVDAEFQRELEDRFDYKVRPEIALTSAEDSEAEVEAILSLIDVRFDVLEWYLDEHDPEFAHFTTFLLNALQHYFWRDEPTKEAWMLIDDRLGAIEERADNLVLMSDHGCSPVDTVFHINQWLEQEGYLSTEAGLSVYLNKLGMTKERASDVAEAFGVRRLARKLPRSVKNIFPQADEGAKREAKSKMIAWDATVAVASGQGPIYVKEGTGDAATDIATALEELETPSGRPVIETVYTREEAYSGRFMDRAPELVVDQADGVHISGGVGLEETFSPPSRWSAENDRNGLFLAVGEDFAAGTRDPISILDIAPTLLHLMEVPVSRDMEGEVLDIFERELGEIQYRDPIQISDGADSTGSTVENRLEDLGYIGQ